jgi:uncharacterized membrane protein
MNWIKWALLILILLGICFATTILIVKFICWLVRTANNIVDYDCYDAVDTKEDKK